MKSLLFLLFPLLLFSQSRQKGQVYKRTPQHTNERLSETGLVVVTRTMYGLRFEDGQIPQFYKDLVMRFLKKNPRNYTQLKTYELRISKKFDDYYIDGVLVSF